MLYICRVKQLKTENNEHEIKNSDVGNDVIA